MIRPSRGTPAPSQSTLHFLRQLVFSRGPITTRTPRRCLRRLHCGGSSLRPELSTAAAEYTSPKKPGKTVTYKPPQIPEYTETPAVEPNKLPVPREYPRHEPHGDNIAFRPLRPFHSRYMPPLHLRWTDITMQEIRQQVRPKWRLTVQEEIDNYRAWGKLLSEDLEAAYTQYLHSRLDGISEFMIQKMGKQMLRVFESKNWTHRIPQAFFYMTWKHPGDTNANDLNICLRAYKRENTYKKLERTYTPYVRAGVEPNPDTYELIVDALLRMRKVDDARILVRGLAEHGRNSYYSIYLTYLDGISQAGMPFDQVETEFRWIRKQNPQFLVSFYGVMIERALMSGAIDHSKTYLRKMIADNCKPTDQTFAVFLQRQSSLGDWEGIQITLREMKRKKHKITPRGLRVMLRNYASTHTVEDLEEFFKELLYEGAEPTTAAFNILIEYNLKAHRYVNAVAWFRHFSTFGLAPDPLSFSHFYSSLRNCNAVASDKLVARIGVVNRSIIPPSIRWRYTGGPEPNTPDLAPAASDTAPTHEAADIYQAVYTAVAEHRTLDAINIFRNSIATATPSPNLLKLVARAYVSAPLDSIPSSARDTRRSKILQEANRLVRLTLLDSISTELTKSSKRDTATHSDHTMQQILTLTIAVYKMQHIHALPISHNFVHQVAILISNTSDHLATIRFMKDIAATPWGREQAWDVHSYTVLIRAYANLLDIRGIAWVLDCLEKNGIYPTRAVKKHLDFAIKYAEGEKAKEALAMLQEKMEGIRSAVKEQVGLCVLNYENVLKGRELSKEYKERAEVVVRRGGVRVELERQEWEE